MKESDIVREHGSFWVYSEKNIAYHVMKIGITHSHVIVSFPYTQDGLSLAEAYFNYHVKREQGKTNEILRQSTKAIRQRYHFR